MLGLLPRDLRNLETARTSFNRLSGIEWQRIRDFLILHYIANERVGDPFWDHCRNMDVPPTLAEKISLFRESGSFIREEDELFLDDSWGQVMIGQGIMPESWSPLADNVPTEDIGPFLTSLSNAYRTKAGQLPTHAEFIGQMMGGTA